METTVLTWSVTNWITVVLMVALGYVIFGLIAQIMARKAA